MVVIDEAQRSEGAIYSPPLPASTTPVTARPKKTQPSSHIGLFRRAHDAGRVHFDRLQINRANLHPVFFLRRADWIFLAAAEHPATTTPAAQPK